MAKTIIAGSRTITDYTVVCDAIAAAKWTITEVVCGGARGVDMLGARWGREHDVPVRMFPAEWDRYGRRAGYERNKVMAAYADALVAVTMGSKGTAHMIEVAEAMGLRVYVRYIGV